MTEIIKHSEWLDKGTEKFGKNKDDWIFECPSCKHKQSVNSVIEHNPELKKEDVRKWIYFNCEGRTNEENGCDWTLGGLFQIHTLEILWEDNSKSKVFNFA